MPTVAIRTASGFQLDVPCTDLGECHALVRAIQQDHRGEAGHTGGWLEMEREGEPPVQVLYSSIEFAEVVADSETTSD